MVIAVLVVADHALLYAILCDGKRDANAAVALRRRGLHAELERIQGGSRIARGGIRKKSAGLLREFGAPVSVPALLVRHGAVKQRSDIRRRKRF